MKPAERLFWARCDGDNAWRAHSAVMSATTSVRRSPAEGALFMTAALSMSQELASVSDSVFALEYLLNEIDDHEKQDYFSLQHNSRLGVGASFESFAKTLSAALGYEVNWIRLAEGERLIQDTDCDFSARFSRVEKGWEGSNFSCLRTALPAVNSEFNDPAAEVFWPRHQLAHTADNALQNQRRAVFPVSFSKVELIALGSDRWRLSVPCVKETVWPVSDETPYLEAIE